MAGGIFSHLAFATVKDPDLETDSQYQEFSANRAASIGRMKTVRKTYMSSYILISSKS
jgi:hypothetical protein